MNNKNRLAVFLMVFILASAIEISPAFSKGPPAKVIIDGPGIKAGQEIADEKALGAFSRFQFEDVENPVNVPENPGPGFTITRFLHLSSRVSPWDQLV